MDKEHSEQEVIVSDLEMKYPEHFINQVICGDCVEVMRGIPDKSVDLVLTSPPYNIGKEYESKKEIGLYLSDMENKISSCIRISDCIVVQVGNIINDGEVFPIDILLYPVFKNHGYRLRNRIIWKFGHGLHCKNRFSGRYETALWFTKYDRYTFNLDSVRIPSKYPNKKHFKGDKIGQISGNPLGKNPSDVWDITNVKYNHPEKTDHPCQFPLDLVNRFILSLTNRGDTILDPFLGSGTTAVSARHLGRNFIGIEINPDYCKIAEDRLAQTEIFTPEPKIKYEQMEL